MRSPRRPVLALLLAAAGLAAPASASAAAGQESQMQDDPVLVYGTGPQVAEALDTMKALGADRIRVTLQWRLVAPAAESRRRPRFDATDPAAYPDGAWRRFDRVVFLAKRRGLAVNFNITGPGPRWAMRHVRRRDIQHVYAPSPREFQRFVTAAGRRYARGASPQDSLHVDFWSVWNEPNQGAWLAPQWTRRDRLWVEYAPRRYRQLVDAAWRGLVASGHSGETLLIGELAPGGVDDRGRTRPIEPRPFLRALYCLDRRMRPLRGRSAMRRGCPSRGSRRSFVAAHPGLFQASGFAHHPYALLSSPRRRSRDRDHVALADLARLRTDLRRVFRAYRVRRAPDLFLTEYGYQTDPPDPYGGLSPDRQAAWLNEANFRAWRLPYVRMVSQFLLRDDAPDRRYRRNSAQYWRTFQTGLLEHDGDPKPSYYAYRVPIHITDRVKPAGSHFRVWGQVRPPGPGAARVSVQWRPRGGGADAWRTLETVSTDGIRGYLQAYPVLPAGSGEVRLAWTDPGGTTMLASRHVNVRAG